MYILALMWYTICHCSKASKKRNDRKEVLIWHKTTKTYQTRMVLYNMLEFAKKQEIQETQYFKKEKYKL